LRKCFFLAKRGRKRQKGKGKEGQERTVLNEALTISFSSVYYSFHFGSLSSS
jgi:hypothetical protein